MPARNQPLNNKPRLNPFAFPAETNGRFAMLILAAVALCWQITFMLVSGGSILDHFQESLSTAQKFSTIYNRALAGRATIFDLQDNEIAAFARDIQPLLQEAHSIPLFPLLLPMFVALALIVGGFLVYRRHPQRIRSRAPLIRVTDDTAPELAAYIRDIAREAGLPPPEVDVQIGENPQAINGLAFGFRRQGMLLLRGDLKGISRRAKQRNSEQLALVLHEMGHLAGQDAWRTHFAVAAWKIFRILIFGLLGLSTVAILARNSNTVPLLGRLITAGQLPVVWAQVLLLLGIVRMFWGELLRVRECYADHWAQQHQQQDALQEVLRSKQDLEERLLDGLWPLPIKKRLLRIVYGNKPPGARWAIAAQCWRKRASLWMLHPATAWLYNAFWHLHPSYETRLRMLEQPHQLFRIPRRLPVLTGILLAFVFSGSVLAVGSLLLPLTYITEPIFWYTTPAVMRLPAPLSRIIFWGLFLMKTFIPILIGLGILLSTTPLVTSTLGIQVQRELIADLDRGADHGRAYLRLLAPAALLALGFQLGLWITPLNLFAPHSWIALLLVPVWLAFFTLLTWLWLIYTRIVAYLKIATHASPDPPRPSGRFARTIQGMILPALYAPVLFALFVIPIVLSPTSNAFDALSASTPGGMSNSAFWTFSVFVLAVIAYCVYFVLAMLFLGAISLREWLRSRSCPECGARATSFIALGRRCQQCDNQLAPWAYVRSHLRAKVSVSSLDQR
jgi:Zn-dependent protease with chaperone function